ncbi:MAG: hypothetical protein GEU97_05840 [Actinophytocola sp.]|nr:hypothetical protein [Actinophytocola sp.]
MINRRWRGTAAAVTAAALALGTPAAVGQESGSSEAQAAEQPMMLLVHGYGDASEGKDCNGSTWDKALAYYQDEGGRDRGSMRTIGYYEGDDEGDAWGDHGCDDIIGDGAASNDRPIEGIARDFANYIYEEYTAEGESVDIVAHSMGGLVTRVAVLGTGEGWAGFPPDVAVDDIVTLGTPHKGLQGGCDDPDEDGCDTQWHQMTHPDKGGSGFIAKLHESEPGADDRGLDDEWAAGIDWSLAGSAEDDTVSYDSAIDKGHFAHQKYGYDEDLNNNGTEDCQDPDVSHSAIRELSGAGGYCLRYWHHGEDGGPYTTDNGWSPLKVAFKAATYEGDDLPR